MIVLFLAALAAGQVCMPAPCIPADRVFAVEPAEQERIFVWIDGAGTELAFGAIDANASTVDVDAISIRRVFLSIDGAERPVTVSADAWKWTLADAAALRLIRVPRGVTALEISAPRHRPITLDLPDAERIALGRVVLQRYDTLAGRVVVGKSGDTPVAAARIETAGGVVLAHTDGDGRFEIDVDAELARRWPAALQVHAPGYGRKILSLTELPQPRRWNRIELSTGGGLRVRVQHDEEVALELRRHRGQGGPEAFESVARGVAAPGGEAVVFEDLDAGRYVLTCTGTEALAQLAHDVEIHRGEIEELDVEIEPVPLRIEVVHGGRPVAGAGISIDFRNRWSARVAAPAGIWEGVLWQRGDLGAFVTVPERGSYSARKAIDGAAEVEWRIEIPDRAVHGRVRDRATGAPLAGIAVDLMNDRRGATALTDENGAYRFEFLEPGAFTVSVASRGHLPSSMQVALGQHDHARQLDFDLVRGTPARVRFLTPDGRPAARTRVFDPVQPDSFGESDERGELELFVTKGETRRLFAVPWQGAFAIFDVTATDDTHVVRFQEGTAQLTISAKDEAGQPISGLRFRLRFNGQDLPNDVLQWLAARDGNHVQTAADGVSILSGVPLGVYELWPVISARGPSPAVAPVRLAAQAGDNPVRLTFTRW